MHTKNIEAAVGLLIIAAAAALIFLTVKVAGARYYLVSPGQTYELTAYFANIGNIKSGAPVRTAGVLVGRVARVELDRHNYQAKLSLQIQRRYHFADDTVASVLTSGLLGEQYIGLQQGAATDELKPGGTINITNSAVVLEELINNLLVNIFNKSR